MSIVASSNEGENSKTAPNSEHVLRGGDLGNTRLANRQRPLETGGEDTAEIGVGVIWPPSNGKEFASIFGKLMEAKEKAQKLKSATRLEYNGLLLAVHPRGWGSGHGKGVYYDYRIELEGIKLHLAHQYGPILDLANVRADIGSVTLMTLRGLASAWTHTQAVIERLGGVILWNKLSRVDCCVDQAGGDVVAFVELVRLGHAVTKVRKKKYHEDGVTWTGISVAPGGATSLRVYDKAVEVYLAKPDLEKARLLEALRWGGPVRHALRIEWQLRRAALAKFGVTSVEDYLEHRSAVVLNLMTRWLRLTIAPPDRKNNNTQRAETHPIWDELLALFQSWMGTADTPAERIASKPLLRPERDAAQALGCLLRYYAYEMHGEVPEVAEIRLGLHRSLDNILEKVRDKELLERYESKAVLLAVRMV